MKKLIYFAKSMNIGGVEKALVSRLNSLNFEENDVTLVLEEKSGDLLPMIDSRVHIEEYSLCTCRFTLFRKALNFYRRMLWKHRKGNKYDYSCSFCTYSVIGSRLAQYASTNCELWVHNNYSDLLPNEKCYSAFFTELRVSAFASIVFVSNEGLEGFKKAFPELGGRCRVEANIIDAESVLRLSSEPIENDNPGRKTTFIYIGRLEEEQKRISRMLKAFSFARSVRDDIRLWLVGDGPDRLKYEELAAQLGIAADVSFFGAQINPYKYLNAADCLLLSSDYEGFPVVYQEAMILGKDIITTISASNGEFDIKEHAAVVPCSAPALAEAIKNYGYRE